MATSNGRAHDYLTLTWDLVLIDASLAAIQELHGLLLTLIRVALHAFVTTDSADYTRLLAASMLTQTVLAAKVGRRQLAIAVRVLRLVFVKKAPILLD